MVNRVLFNLNKIINLFFFPTEILTDAEGHCHAFQEDLQSFLALQPFRMSDTETIFVVENFMQCLHEMVAFSRQESSSPIFDVAPQRTQSSDRCGQLVTASHSKHLLADVVYIVKRAFREVRHFPLGCARLLLQEAAPAGVPLDGAPGQMARLDIIAPEYRSVPLDSHVEL